VTIGVDPTSMPYAGVSHGQLIGMDTDIARAIAKQAGLKANIIQLTFDNAVPALKSGRADASLVGGWFDDATRQGQMNVISYYQAPVGFVVKQGNPSHVGGTWQGRCGLTLATYTSSPDYLNILKADSAKCTKAGKKAITVTSFAGLAPGVLAVRSGRIDGFMDGVPAVAYQAKVNHLTYVPATDQPVVIWGIGVRKNDPALATQLATALKAVTASGQVAQIWKKYGFPSSILISPDKITVNGKYKNG
jgi:polar amino acid transport system substrate-binding protein